MIQSCPMYACLPARDVPRVATGPSGPDQKNADAPMLLTAVDPIDHAVRRTEELRNG